MAGTIAGGNASGTQVGVAPGAELMGWPGDPERLRLLAQVIAGMEWAIAPYDADGKPAGGPADVVSMSLGAEGFEDQTGVTTLVSVALDGANGNGGSREQSISADGRCVTFVSDATNLVTDDVAGQRDMFVRDLQTGTTRRIAGSRPGENSSPVLSADGRKVAFANMSAPDWNRHQPSYGPRRQVDPNHRLAEERRRGNRLIRRGTEDQRRDNPMSDRPPQNRPVHPAQLHRPPNRRGQPHDHPSAPSPAP